MFHLSLICSLLTCSVSLFVQAQNNLWPDPSFTNSPVGFSPQVAARSLNNAAGSVTVVELTGNKMCEMSNKDAAGGQIIEWRFFASSGQTIQFSAWIKSEAPDWHTTLAIQNPSPPYTQFAETKGNSALLGGARLVLTYEITNDNFRETGGNFVAQIKIRKIVAMIWVDEIELVVGQSTPPPPPPPPVLPVPTELSFTLQLRSSGLNFIHIPLADPVVKTVADVYHKIGSGLQMVIFFDPTISNNFESYYEPFNSPEDPVNIILKPYTGLIAVMASGVNKTVTFTGQPFSDNQVKLVKGKEGLNLVGLPVNDPRLTKFSQLTNLSPSMVMVAGQDQGNGQVKGYPGVDLPIIGGQSLIVIVSADTTLQLSGQPWQQTTTTAAPAVSKKWAEDFDLVLSKLPPSARDQLTVLLQSIPDEPPLEPSGKMATTWGALKGK